MGLTVEHESMRSCQLAAASELLAHQLLLSLWFATVYSPEDSLLKLKLNCWPLYRHIRVKREMPGREIRWSCLSLCFPVGYLGCTCECLNWSYSHGCFTAAANCFMSVSKGSSPWNCGSETHLTHLRLLRLKSLTPYLEHISKKGRQYFVLNLPVCIVLSCWSCSCFVSGSWTCLQLSC